MVTVQPYKMIYNNGVVVLGEVFRLTDASEGHGITSVNAATLWPD